MIENVAPGEWVAKAQAARDAGFSFFDWMDVVDEIGRADEFRVCLALENPATGGRTELHTRVPRSGPELASLREVFAGAGWAERELADLFGVVFVGGDPRPLLLTRRFDGHPLRKDAVLPARIATHWPGSKEPGESASAPSRRRMVPVGVPDGEVWGARPAEADEPDAAEVAAAVTGGRVRRRGARGGQR